MLIIDQCFKIKGEKLVAAQKIYKDNEINGIIYFVNLDLMKNKNYYKKLISLSENYKIRLIYFCSMAKIFLAI
jgi:hypothetical protein